MYKKEKKDRGNESVCTDVQLALKCLLKKKMKKDEKDIPGRKLFVFFRGLTHNQVNTCA